MNEAQLWRWTSYTVPFNSVGLHVSAVIVMNLFQKITKILIALINLFCIDNTVARCAKQLIKWQVNVSVYKLIISYVRNNGQQGALLHRINDRSGGE